MTTVCPDSRTFLDPFCGSGTVLYEALSRGRETIGLEINPAAWHLAALASTASLSATHAASLAKELREITGTSSYAAGELYSPRDTPEAILDRIHDPSTDPALKLALSATVILGMGNTLELTHNTISRGAFQVLSVLKEISQATGCVNCLCMLADARRTALSSGSIESVITSPPYINVFNYHQNYRPAAEMLGWHVLDAARTEIGSNRKHRMNRFLTVTQYCLDMALFIDEMSRVLTDDGHLIIVLGRTSNVLGCSFRNSALIRDLIIESAAFDLPIISERVFTSRFGEKIYEDIIITRKRLLSLTDPNIARRIAASGLEEAMDFVPSTNKVALKKAIESISEVQPSPALKLTVPRWFKNIEGIA